MRVRREGPPNPQRQPFPVPWGLFLTLGVYGLVVLGWLWLAVWGNDDHQAARHYGEARALLGVDDGRSAKRRELEQAFEHLLEAARLAPQERWLQEQVQEIRGRFAERRWKLPVDLERRAESVALMHQRWAEANKATFVVGVRDRGWAADQLAVTPVKILVWSLPGVVAIVVVWGWLEWKRRQVRAQTQRARAKEEAEAIDAIGAQRRR